MNPLRWFRWKVLVVLTLVVGGIAFFGVNPLAKAGINKLGAAGYGARWRVQDFNFNPGLGRLSLGGVDVANAAVPAGAAPESAQFLAAQTATFDIDMMELLRRRYHGEMHVDAPKLRIERRADGSLNIDFGGDEAGPATGEPTDWWVAAQRWIEQIRQWDEQRRAIEQKIPDKVEEKAKEIATKKDSRFRVDYSRRVTYPFENIARLVATKLIGEGLEVAFIDNTLAGRARGAVPPLKNGRIEITNVSDNPAAHPEPVQWQITGEISGAPIRLVGQLDQRATSAGGIHVAKNELQFDFEADGLPLELVEFFAGDSLPLQFERGTLKLATTARISDWDRLNVAPVLGFRDAVAAPRPGARSVAGLDPEIFCRAFNEVGTMEIDDLRVTGTVSQPEVQLGHTLTNLVRNGGRAIAKKQFDRGVQLGTEKLNEAVGKELGKLGGKSGANMPDPTNKVLGGAKDAIGDRLKGLPFGDQANGDKNNKNSTRVRK